MKKLKKVDIGDKLERLEKCLYENVCNTVIDFSKFCDRVNRIHLIKIKYEETCISLLIFTQTLAFIYILFLLKS